MSGFHTVASTRGSSVAEADHLQGSESAHASSSRAPAQRLGAQDAPVATANQAQGLVGNLPARGDNLQRRQRGVAPMDNTTLQLSDRSDSASLQTSGAQIQDARAQVPLPPGIECIAPEAEPAPSRQQATAGPSRTVNPPQGTTSKLSTLLATQLRDLALERKQEIDAAMRDIVPTPQHGEPVPAARQEVVHGDPVAARRIHRRAVQRRADDALTHRTR